MKLKKWYVQKYATVYIQIVKIATKFLPCSHDVISLIKRDINVTGFSTSHIFKDFDSRKSLWDWNRESEITQKAIPREINSRWNFLSSLSCILYLLKRCKPTSTIRKCSQTCQKFAQPPSPNINTIIISMPLTTRRNKVSIVQETQKHRNQQLLKLPLGDR